MKKRPLIFVALLLSSQTGVALSTPAVEYGWHDQDDWYYKKGRKYQGWKYIVIHHSATDAGSVRAFHRFHTKQGYGGVAYHFVIGNGKGMKDGEVKETFRWQKQMSGTHVTVNSWDHNIFGIGICLVGNMEKNPPTPAQEKALHKLIRQLQEKHQIPDRHIIGHKHVTYDDGSGQRERTNCPGRKLKLEKYRKPQLSANQ